MTARLEMDWPAYEAQCRKLGVPAEPRPGQQHDVAPAPPPEPKSGAIPDFATEKEFQADVVKRAKAQGWIAYHTHDSRRSADGFPDLVLAHEERGVLFLECKSPIGKATDPQLTWLATLTAAGQEARVVRPEDMEWIVEALARGVRGSVAFACRPCEVFERLGNAAPASRLAARKAWESAHGTCEKRGRK